MVASEIWSISKVTRTNIVYFFAIYQMVIVVFNPDFTPCITGFVIFKFLCTMHRILGLFGPSEESKLFLLGHIYEKNSFLSHKKRERTLKKKIKKKLPSLRLILGN
jgi:hypothetical protein